MSFSNARKENIAAKMRRLNTTEKEGQLLTACIRNSGFSAKSKVSAFNKSHCQTESEVLLIRYCSYTQTVGQNIKLKQPK
jgi:hypothetical protein